MESKTIEHKREYTEDIKYAVIAFANTDGGKIYIGVDDDGHSCGVPEPDKVMLQVTNMIRDVIRPDVTMFTDCNASEIEGNTVIITTVIRGTARPYYLAGKGVRPEGVYVRQGSSSVPASETAILNMIKETSGDCYEASRSLNQQLTFEKASSYFTKKGIDFGEVQMRTLNLIGGDKTFTNLAMLLSDQCVHTLKLAIFQGSQKTIFLDRREFSGSLLEQLEEAFSYIDLLNRTKAEFVGLERLDKRNYPPEAIREALLNAIVHRDYSISASTLISIFDDRIEFVSIGGLVRGISFDDIMLGVSVLRNPRLANIFYRLKLIEAYGTGILKIYESYAESEKKPKIEVSNNAFKITLPNTNFILEHVKDTEITTKYVPQEERQDFIMKLFNTREVITRKDIEIALKVSQATAILIIREMLAQGQLVKEKGGKYSRYRRGNF